MSRKTDKKRRSISSAQKQRQQSKLDPETCSHASPQLSKPADETISVPIMLTIDQLGHWLNLSRSTIHRLDKAGKLPGRVLLGRQVRYHRPAIESWLEERLT